MALRGPSGADVSLVVSVFRSERYIRRFASKLREFATGLSDYPELTVEIVLVLNEPSSLEQRVARIIDGLASGQFAVATEIVPRETLYASWNRGIQLAKGDILGFWNVDDTRFLDAVAEAVVAIRGGAQLTYSPFYFYTRWRRWGLVPREVMVLKDPPTFEREVFRRTFLIGPFFVFSRSLYEEAGPFDEQFRIAGDLEWGLRALSVAPFTRVASVAGLHLNENRGLSTSGSEVVYAELQAIYCRHGVTETLPLVPESLAEEYDPRNMTVSGRSQPWPR